MSREQRGTVHRTTRLSDWVITGAVLLAVGCFVGGYLWVHSLASKASQAAQRAERLTEDRTHDLVATCLRSSQRNAADLNLNWLYYLSEIELARGGISRQSLRSVLGAFAPGEAAALGVLLRSGGSSKRILIARATADYDAARAKAASVDLGQLRLVRLHTALDVPGHAPLGEVPREWVRHARFSCQAAYSQ